MPPTPTVEIVAHTERRIANSEIASGEEANPDSPLAVSHSLLHDVTVRTTRTRQCARVEGVPPEEFGIARNARSIRDADYCFHDVLRSEARLIAQGYDREQVRRLPSHGVADTIEAQARDTVEEGTQKQGDEGHNTASRLIRVTEHYVRMDYEDQGTLSKDGRERPGVGLYRVTTAGEGEVLKRDGEPDVIEVDEIPFAAMTPVIVTHRFFGRSIADLVMDIQRIKTALLRALLDNAYLANNPRTEVPESHATETTLDDLLVSRPGGIVRTKLPGGLSVIAHPDVGGHVFPLLQYQDATREWRTGVSRQGQGVDPNVLQNQVATIANQMFNAAQAKMKMIARIFAETGIRDLFALLHAVVRKHGSQPQTARLRNQWITVDPRDWKARNDMTINVGLGTGTKTEQLAHLNMVIGAQEKAIAAGLVSPKNLYNSARELTKLAGHKNVGLFFTPPGTPSDPDDPASAPIQPPSDPKAQEAQQRIELEKAKAAADGQLSAQKHQADQQMSAARIAADTQFKREQLKIEFELKVQQMNAEFALRREQMAAEMALKREQMQLDAQARHGRGDANAAAHSTIADASAAASGGIDGVRMGGEIG